MFLRDCGSWNKHHGKAVIGTGDAVVAAGGLAAVVGRVSLEV